MQFDKMYLDKGGRGMSVERNKILLINRRITSSKISADKVRELLIFASNSKTNNQVNSSKATAITKSEQCSKLCSNSLIEF